MAREHREAPAPAQQQSAAQATGRAPKADEQRRDVTRGVRCGDGVTGQFLSTLGKPGMLTAQRQALVAQAAATLGNHRLAGILAVVQRDTEAERVKTLNENYEKAIKASDWKAAAEYLNGFNREDIIRRLAKRSVAEIAEIHTGAVGNPRVGAQAQVALLTPVVLIDFARKFRASADLVWRSPEAMALVQEAETGGVKFGGYAEDGPGKDPWAYTVGDTVYVPRARTDPVLAMNSFLFELNNALRRSQLAALATEATAGKVDAKEYARRIVEQEVEGMLRLGKVWLETKKVIGGKKLDKYDLDFYLAEYKEFKGKKKTKADIIKDVLGRKYTAGKNKGKTVEKYYMEEYKTLNP